MTVKRNRVKRYAACLAVIGLVATMLLLAIPSNEIGAADRAIPDRPMVKASEINDPVIPKDQDGLPIVQSPDIIKKLESPTDVRVPRIPTICSGHVSGARHY